MLLAMQGTKWVHRLHMLVNIAVAAYQWPTLADCIIRLVWPTAVQQQSIRDTIYSAYLGRTTRGCQCTGELLSHFLQTRRRKVGSFGYGIKTLALTDILYRK